LTSWPKAWNAAEFDGIERWIEQDRNEQVELKGKIRGLEERLGEGK
jgi:hypothetical protein